jgi:hypothetical protein
VQHQAAGDNARAKDDHRCKYDFPVVHGSVE